MNLLQRVHAAHRFDPTGFRPFYCAGIRLGWVRNDHLPALARRSEVFVVEDDRVSLSARLATPAQRTDALAAAMRALAAEGAIRGWRDEAYAIAESFGAPPLFHIERAAVRMLGLTSCAVHVNGVVGWGRDCRMWVARRSAQKPIDPGLLDNLVGGGLAAGLSVEQTLVKEGWEEAGIAADTMRRCIAGAQLRVSREVTEGLQSELVFTHDLELPTDFTPVNRDGEVAGFRLLPIGEVIALLRDSDELTLDASLVMLEFLLRRGYIGPDEPGRDEFASVIARPVAAPAS